jgi:hypothetical protein
MKTGVGTFKVEHRKIVVKIQETLQNVLQNPHEDRGWNAQG